MAVKVIRKFRLLFDVAWGSPNDGDVPIYDSGTDKLVMGPQTGGGGGGAPSGPAGGVLGGTYPDPSFAVDMATQAEVDAAIAAAIAALLDSAPGALDTLNELAAALGDDPNFATSVTNALAGKQPLDADLTSIAALTTTAYGRSLLEAASASALRTLAGLVIGTDVPSQASLTDHLNDTTAHTAENIPFTPGGSIAATNVQDAIEEVASEAGGSGSGDSMVKSIAQTAHGLSVGEWVYHDGVEYVLAQADDPDTAEVDGVVIAVADVDNFTLANGGYVSVLSGLTAGAVHYLSATVAGALDDAEPTDTGHVSKPVFRADSTTAGWIYNLRGAEVTQEQPLVAMPDSFAGSADADFNGTLGPWVAVAGASGTIDFLETGTGTAKYDLASAPGYLLVQTGHAALVEFRCDYTLADGESFVAAIAVAGPNGGDNMAVTVRLNESNDALSTTGNWVACMVEQDTTEWVFQANSSADAAGNEIASVSMYAGQIVFLRVVRSGTTYSMWCSLNGMSWQFIYQRTAVATPYANIWLSFLGPSSGLTYMTTHAVAFTKVGAASAVKAW